MRRIISSGLLIVMLLAIPFLVASQGRDNDNIIAPGNISGYVMNYYGLAISGATVGIENGPVTTSGADGFYFLGEIESGEYTLGCGKTGYNPVIMTVTVVSGDTLTENFNLTQPTMVINPLSVQSVLNPGEYVSTSISVLNTGSGPLGWHADISYLSMPSIPCTYSIALYDTWGDGWNGCSLDVLVNDSVVLNNITLNSGSGPAVFYFPVYNGDEITTDFNPGPFVSEPYYYIYNGAGEQVWFSPAGNNGPPDVLPGQLLSSCSNGEWLSMDYYQDTVPPFGGLNNIPTHLDATGTSSGETYQAEITFTSVPFVGQVTVPVDMIVQGPEIIPPENITAVLEDPVEGKIVLSWDWESNDAFQFFLVKRNGNIIATTTSQEYDDFLPEFGYYCYTVQAVYNEGLSAPDGPACAEWPNPVLHVDPSDLEDWVWTGYTVDVFTTISNSGEGTLSYSFPEFAALHLLNDPSVEKNKQGSPPGLTTASYQKGDDNLDGKGYPVVLGAGGPDNFGYTWIDSDEDGGPVFGFTDISTTGTPVFGLSDDNIVGPFNIGFEFYYYGTNKSQFWINSNGCVGFTSSYITIQNTAIPTNSSVYKDFIAWMWDDLVFRPGTSQVFYQVYSDRLIIQFKNYEQIYLPGKFINAEIILYKSGRIKIEYDNFSQGILLNSCSIGLQSSNPAVGLQVVFNAAYLHNDLAIIFNRAADFITDVNPAYGTVPENGSENIAITYDSKDYTPGIYHDELTLESNDLAKPEFSIENTMHVYLPAYYSGTVSDNDSEEPLNGVLVTAGPYQTTTGEDGGYTLYVDAGTYDVTFTKLGYMPLAVEDTASVQGQVTPLDIGMWDMNYAPGFVHAEVVANGDWCQVNWSLPDGPYEIIMDDGEADDFFVFAHSGSWHAVKFTPSGYPSTIIGGSFYVGDGSFPGPFLGTEFGVAVFDDDGTNGLPGTMIDSVGVTVNNSGWVSLDWLNADITEGSFYLAMYQAGDAPNAAPIGVDNDSPVHFKSYSKILANDWSLSPFQDFMIRAWVHGPEGNEMTENAPHVLKSIPRIPPDWKSYAMTWSGKTPVVNPGYERCDASYKGVQGMGTRDVATYRIFRCSNFDPDTIPGSGYAYDLATTDNLSYLDLEYYSLMMGWYAYGVKAQYTSGDYSDFTYSNVVGHLMDVNVTVTTSLTTGEEPSGIEVTLEGLDYPRETFQIVTGPNGVTAFDQVWKGKYNIRVYKIGFEAYVMDSVEIQEDKEFTIILSEKKYPPRNLVVDPVSAIATWDPPLMTALKEGFEGDDFPPPGWQSLTASPGYGWFRSKNASSEGFVIPPWDSFYAVVNNDTAGSENNGCCDYLVTPAVDLRESEGFVLHYDSYYNGTFGQLAFVEYSLDEGATWEVLRMLEPDTSWVSLEVDLSDFSGPEGPPKIWIAFHADDNGIWASGWAIDNVTIQVPAPAADYVDFYVFLDDVYMGNTTDTRWDFAPLPYGQTYTASVAAHYSSGLSSKVHYTFTSRYLFPPQDVEANAPDDAAIITWNPPGPGVPVNLLGYNLYRNDALVCYQDHLGNWQMQGYADENLDPGIYEYTVTGVYDLTPYGFPGESGESMKAGPAEVVVDYCNELEFLETWEIGGFSPNEWETEGPNWSINGQAGNPPPVAEFTFSPVQTDYEISLISYPLCAVGLTEGEIWLDFDLELYSLQATGQEFLRIQAWNWIDQEWVTMTEFDNSNGNILLTKEHVNISTIAMNAVFKIRFQAKGASSASLRGWFVDNIHVYRTCPAPQNLEIDPYFGEGIRLSWDYNQKSETEGGNGTRELQGFNIYRSKNGSSFDLLAFTTEMPFIDPENNLEIGTSYCYRISAVNESPTDQCESDLSNEACVIWTSLNDNKDIGADGISLYPNPATDKIFISSGETITRITIVHVSGITVYERSTNEKNLEINLTDCKPGSYIIRCETADGIMSRLLTVQR